MYQFVGEVMTDIRILDIGRVVRNSIFIYKGSP